jgi:hypothetical protein
LRKGIDTTTIRGNVGTGIVNTVPFENNRKNEAGKHMRVSNGVLPAGRKKGCGPRKQTEK